MENGRRLKKRDLVLLFCWVYGTIGTNVREKQVTRGDICFSVCSMGKQRKGTLLRK